MFPVVFTFGSTFTDNRQVVLFLWTTLHVSHLCSFPSSSGYHCIIYYEQQITRELKGIRICGCRCNERLNDKTDESTRLTYTGLCGKMEHLKMETRLIGVSFECLMGECVMKKLNYRCPINIPVF